MKKKVERRDKRDKRKGKDEETKERKIRETDFASVICTFFTIHQDVRD